MANWTTDQQQAINEDGSNIIVSAGAGSGKTAVLSARVLRKINDPDPKRHAHVNELLILTFTNAAAQEMKDRIRKEIKKSGNEEELALVPQSYITTFDSFALSILRKYHYVLNLPKNISISDASVIHLKEQEILDQIFDKMYQNPSEAFTSLIKDFTVRNDKDLKELIINLYRSINIRTDKDEYINNYITNNFNEETYSSLIEEYKSIVNNQILMFKDEIESLSSYFEDKYYSSLLSLVNSYILEEDFNTKISIIKSSSLPRLTKADDETKIQRDKLKAINDELKAMVSFGLIEDALNGYKNTKVYLEVIFDIIKELNDKITTWKLDNLIFDFTDIASLSLKILKEHEDIRLEIRDSFKEIMIDEYQDTSDTQEEFISLISNNNVYMVGDIKQSIYRFRNANPYIFKNKYDNYSKGINGKKIDLVKNFRSRREVLDNINTLFRPIMDDTYGNANYTKEHQMVFGNTTYEEAGLNNENHDMDILVYEKPKDYLYTNEEIEIFKIAKDIKEKINNKYPIFDGKKCNPASYSDFCIIIDKNAPMDLFKKIFEYEGIPLSVYKDEELNVSDDIYIFKNLITLVNNFSNYKFDDETKYAFTSVARSYLYRLSDEEIFDILENGGMQQTDIYKDLESISKNLNELSAKEIVNRIIINTKFYQKLITHGNTNESSVRIEKILETAISFDNLGYKVSELKEYFDSVLDGNEKIKYDAGVSSGNAVKIMNIHKSKGLQFPICYFALLSSKFNRRDAIGDLIYFKGMPIYMPYVNNYKVDTFLKLLIKDRLEQEDTSEKIRLWYVALTRCKEKMIILLPYQDRELERKDSEGVVVNSIRRKFIKLSDFINSIPSEVSKYVTKIDLDSIGLTRDYTLAPKLNNIIRDNDIKFDIKDLDIKEKYIDDASFSKKEHTLIDKETREAMDFGLEMHRFLEMTNFKTVNVDSINNNFKKEVISYLLNSDIFKDIENSEIYKEYEFIYNKDTTEYHGIIDLMVEHDTYIDIVDYKTSNIDDLAYIEQLKGYKEYISSISNKDINCYLFSIVKKELKKLDI